VIEKKPLPKEREDRQGKIAVDGGNGIYRGKNGEKQLSRTKYCREKNRKGKFVSIRSEVENAL